MRYGVPEGRPRRSVVEEVRRAQSRGEWPGESRTLRVGLLGMDVWLGGGRREDELEERGRRLGRGERDGGGIREEEGSGETGPRRGGARAPLEARWAEFRAGNEGAGGESERLKDGMVEEVVVDVARGVVGEEGCLKMGGGGGGMAFRS